MQLLKKKNMNIVVDTFSYVAFVALAMTGVIMYFILPPGSGRSLTIWGLDRHGWGDIHFWAAVTFLGLLVVHLILHWKWIISVLKGSPRTASRSRFILGATGLIAIILISLAPVLSPVQKNGEPGHDRNNHSSIEGSITEDRSGEAIRGSTTLLEVTEISSVPVEDVIDFLGLPEGVDRSMRLGQLKAEYGFDMHELRTFVQDYIP